MTIPFMSPRPCEDRRKLEKRVADAVQQVCVAKAAHEARKSVGNAAALTHAHFSESEGNYDLQNHIEHHRCKRL